MTILKEQLSKRYSYILKDFKNEDIKPVISNTMFKAMLCNSAYRKKYVSYLIALVSGNDYKMIYENIRFENGELDKFNLKDKGMNVDLVCTVKDEIWNIEANGSSTTRFKLHRNIGYADRLYLQKSLVGNKYEYNNVTQISLNNFYFSGKSDIKYTVTMQTDSNDLYTDKKKIIHINIPLIRKKWYDSNEKLTKLEKFILAMNEKSSIELDNLIREEKIMKDYRKDAKMMSLDENILGLYDKEADDECIRLAEENEKKKEQKAFDRKVKKFENREKNFEDRKRSFEDKEKKFKDKQRIFEDKQRTFEDKQRTFENIQKKFESEKSKVFNDGKLDVAKKMIKNKIDINTIIDCTGLSKGVIAGLY